MYYLFSKLIDLFLSPIIWIIIGIVLSAIFTIRKSKIAIKILIATVLFTTFITNPFIANTIFYHWEKDFKNCAIDNTETYDIAIVLSGMVAYGENPQQANFGQSVDRILEAARLYHKGVIKHILITGGNASVHYDQPPESEILFRFLTQMNIPDSAIIMESKARNTHENALYTSELLKKRNLQSKKILLITSAYHMHRSLACFEKQGIAVSPLPVDFYVPAVKTDIGNLFWPSKDAMHQWDILWHEWFGIVYYKLMGYM